MPRQFGKVDMSTAWSCPRCPHKHAPGSACPQPGAWLVLTLCSACNALSRLYCRTHRDRRLPQPVDAHHALPETPEPDVQQRAAGEKGAA